MILRKEKKMYKELTVEEITEKYKNIEDKIPSVWKDYESAGIELAQDILYHWDVSDGELIRVIALIELRVARSGKSGFRIAQHINPMYSFAGLYPERMKRFNINDVNKYYGIKPGDVSPKNDWDETDRKTILKKLLDDRINFKKMKENDEGLE